MREANESPEARIERLERETKNLAAALRRRGAASDDEEWPIVPPMSGPVEEIRGQARRLADLVRTRAVRDAAQIADRVVERAGLRDMLERAGVRPFAWIDPLDEEWDGAADGVRAGARDGVFEGEVDVEIGRLTDSAELSSIEDAAKEIDAADEIKVGRFSRGRATLSFSLDEPVELLRELESHAPCEFQIRSLSDNRIVLDVEPSDSDKSEAA